MLPADTRKEICKGVDCFTCSNKLQFDEVTDPTTGEPAVRIVCNFELSTGIYELPAMSTRCANYSLDPDADLINEDETPIEEVLEDEEEGRPKETDEIRIACLYIDDYLVAVKDPEIEKAAEYVMATNTFIESYNAYVRLTQEEVTRRVEKVQGDGALILRNAKNLMDAAGATGDPSDYFDLSIFEGGFLHEEDVPPSSEEAIEGVYAIEPAKKNRPKLEVEDDTNAVEVDDTYLDELEKELQRVEEESNDALDALDDNEFEDDDFEDDDFEDDEDLSDDEDGDDEE